MNDTHTEEAIAASANDSAPNAQRLHHSTLWLPLLEVLRGALIPGVIASFFFGYERILFFGGCFVLLPTALAHVFRFVSVRYHINEAELVIRSGVISKRDRRIPLERMQDIEIQQSLFHRWFDLAKLEITTAGAEDQEATLDVLSRKQAEALRATILRRQDSDAQSQTTDGSQPAEPRQTLCELTTRDLVKGGLTSNLVASIGAIIGTIFYVKFVQGLGSGIVGTFEEKVTEKVQERLPSGRLFDSVIDFFTVDTIGKGVLLALGGALISIAGFVIRYHGFRLTQVRDVITKKFGLFTVRRSSLAQDRFQAIKLEEGLLRRCFGLASIRADSAGDRNQLDDQKKRDVLVPVTSRDHAFALVRDVQPDLETSEPEWKRVSRLAIMRGTRKGWLLVLALMIQTLLATGWMCLAWLPAIPLVYYLNVQWYRNTGYWVGEKFVLSRRGWLNRNTLFLPVKNIQNVSLTQNPFDRRLNLATVSIDAAGQSNTGGGPVIRNLPIEEARSLHQFLVKQVANSTSKW